MNNQAVEYLHMEKSSTQSPKPINPWASWFAPRRDLPEPEPSYDRAPSTSYGQGGKKILAPNYSTQSPITVKLDGMYTHSDMPQPTYRRRSPTLMVDGEQQEPRLAYIVTKLGPANIGKNRIVSTPSSRQSDLLIAHVGQPYRGKSKNDRSDERAENLYTLNEDTLLSNIGAGRILVKYIKNDPEFNEYVSLPFTKGVTERDTGRTMLIIGSKCHHIEAMRGQFDGVAWNEDKDQYEYGNTVRWINVGGLRDGFIGLDFYPTARQNDGVATTYEDIKFVSQALLGFGYDQNKRLFVLNPPYVNESDFGKEMRKAGFETLKDYARKEFVLPGYLN